jgi:hypothetical protein
MCQCCCLSVEEGYSYGIGGHQDVVQGNGVCAGNVVTGLAGIGRSTSRLWLKLGKRGRGEGARR